MNPTHKLEQNAPYEELDLEDTLRNEFDLDDFLENKILKNELEEEHYTTFKSKTQFELYKLFQHYITQYPYLFSDVDFDELFEFLYSCVIKNYNIEKLYKNYEHTSNLLLEQYDKEVFTLNKMKEKQQQKESQQHHVIFATYPNIKNDIENIEDTEDTCKSNAPKSNAISWASLLKK